MIPSLIFLTALAACGPKSSAPSTPAASEEPEVRLATIHELGGIQSLFCSKTACTINTLTAVHELQLKTMDLKELDASPTGPTPPPEPWAVYTATADINEIWNQQVAKQWRSPFRVDIPAPLGGFYRLNRGVSPGTSRVVRLGGSVVTARQGIDPDRIAYPRNLALHPTGTEAYHIVWPNPDLLAFNARTLETTWRLRLDGPALGLFISEDGRYLLAELDGQIGEHQLLDFDAEDREAPPGTDPWANERLQWLDRPKAARTALVDLALGETVAIVPGSAVGLMLTPSGAIVVGSEGFASVVKAPVKD